MTPLPTDPTTNRQFRYADDLPQEYFGELSAKDPDEVRTRTGASYDPAQKVYQLPILGRPYSVDPATRSVRRLDKPQARVSYMEGLALLMALLKAEDVPPTGELVTERELPGGDLFFQGIHAMPTEPIARRYGSDPEAFVAMAESLAGRRIEGLGDVAVRLMALPRLFVTLVLWLGDDEFKPRLQVLFDTVAARMLPLDALLGLVFVIQREMAGSKGRAIDNTGACGLNCGACLLMVRGVCSACGGGVSDAAQDKLAAQRRLLGEVCPILDCAVRRGVAHCPRDCGDFPCDKFEGYPFSDGFLQMQRRRRDNLKKPS